MAGDSYMTNPDAQQGESTVKKGSRNPATIEGMIQPRIRPEDSVDEGPVDIPEVDPFVHRADDAVDGGHELDPLARLEGGERRLALAKLRPVRGKLKPVDPPEDSLGETVQPHLHGAGGIELCPGVAAVDKQAAGQFLRRLGREQRGRLPDEPGFRRRLFPPVEDQIHRDTSKNREQNEKEYHGAPPAVTPEIG